MEPSASAASLVGATLEGGFQLCTRLARGGLTEMYLAEWRGRKKRVLVKVLDPLYASLPHLKRRLQREADWAPRLGNAVPKVLGSGEIDGRPWLALEKLPGKTLAEHMKHGPLAPRQAASVGLALLDALERIHRAGILHNDLKPTHVMLVRRGVKLLDLDLAMPLGEAADDDAPGTPAHLAPERIEGAAPSIQSDLYAAGLLLFEMMTGHGPFLGDPVAVQRACTSEAAPRLRGLVPSISPALDEVVARTLERDPTARFASAGAMHDALAATPEA